MYKNDGKALTDKYGYSERQAVYNWWQAFKGAEKSLNDQKKFKEAKVVANISKKGVEASYNFYTIEPQSIMDRLGVVVFSLVFYVSTPSGTGSPSCSCSKAGACSSRHDFFLPAGRK